MPKNLFLVFFLMMSCATTPPASQTSPTIRVAIQKEPLVIKEIPLEAYLMGVLAKEVLPDWPLETLKAQAVASRTYTLYRKEHPRSPEENFDIEVTVQDQVFALQEEYPPLITQAVQETAGQILQYDGKVFAAFYHSTCGGISEPAESVWSGEAPFPVNQIHPDPFCEDSPHSHWSYELDKENEGRIEILKRNETGRVALLDFQSHEVSGNSFREMIGYQKIRSTLFEVEEEKDRILLSGRGSGHGVGLCQWGAKGMGDLGYTYQEILEFYYPGATLKNPPLNPPL
ncbi:MAG: SpoIID/LytB domain-containing protein [Deltaproteobacteria bacterium]|nr:SpoIID/LytB domain-containing protein [Deltaproteobacteria bacterium]